MSVLSELSTALADAVESVAPSLVLVDARRGYGATGLAWKSAGLIITASHVVQRDDSITVTPSGGSAIAAQLVGRDRGTDLAVLKADATLDTVIDPAEREARVGNLVLALGSQGTEPPVASFGVVATINRPWRSSRGHSLETLIRSDVTLYPGFSGGPMVDASGKVLGLNTSALTRGLAATLPWSLVEQVAGALASQGSIKRGYLGVVSQPVEIPAQMRESAQVDQETGLLVVAVEPESPAAAAGLMLGDILIGMKGRSVSGVEDLQELLGPGSAGETVPVNLIRGGSATEVTVTIGER
jgi:S1-C subfamily serine protease